MDHDIHTGLHAMFDQWWDGGMALQACNGMSVEQLCAEAYKAGAAAQIALLTPNGIQLQAGSDNQ